MNKKDFTNALTLGFLTPYYDFITNFAGFGPAIYKKITDYISPKAGDKILDVGTGTANLAMTIKRKYPNLEVVGVDPDENILNIAKRKVAKEKLPIELLKGFAQQLPFRDNTFDFVVSSFVIHHIPKPFKKRAFIEMKRVLKKEGTAVIVDFGIPKNFFANIVILIFSLVEDVGPNRQGLIPRLLKEVGFRDVEEIGSKFGVVSFYRARKT
ncbi:hypothetical protein A2693_02490 [Candidatus Curtissbacteria bacterium RIFCSPHIGHO2_01_FULL_40_12]|uniref:Methyltransferase domain-containing protein n=1 Tax=Candidatus Curtissbacteria bacterium RIFCSPHIGHO2_01_FULL_40_12 TaxID=1797710 RepID=A0A1F5GCL5_9BACT|nr:MAG: hypothetical protein A2693_02490 [Candidatus Curtissbacteria bacterium RIFCSPHIGHO2_01_FULL_40_12]